MLKSTATFEAIVPIYQQSTVSEEGDVEVKLGATLFMAYPAINASPIYIIDKRGVIHSKKKSITLSKIAYTDFLKAFPVEERDFMVAKIAKEDMRIKDFVDLYPYTFQTEYSFKDEDVAEWVDVETGQIKEEWFKFTRDLLEFNCKKDPTLVLVSKTALPRGYVMKYQPHQMVITPPNTGKTTIYDLMGKLVDKTTRNTILGGAKWTNDKAYGVFHRQYTVFTIDQIESQNIENIAGFLLGFLESGKANVTGGGAELLVMGAAPFAILANPLALGGTHVNIFREIIQLLCRNSLALGRRFGIIAFGDYAPVQDLGYDSDKHKEMFATFRGLEEVASSVLERIWTNPKVREYCLKPVYDNRDLLNRIYEVEEIEVKAFLSAHYAHAYPHTRGGAINCAIVDNLPLIAYKAITAIGNEEELVDKILVEAEKYLAQLKAINEASIDYALQEEKL